MKADSENANGKRIYNLAFTNEAKELVEKNVPKNVKEKINRKRLGEKEKGRMLFFLAVLIELCDKDKKVKISIEGLSKYIHMKHGFVGNITRKLEGMELISTAKQKGGTLYALKFDLNGETSTFRVEVGEDGVERLVNTTLPETTFTEKEAEAPIEYNVEELLSVVKDQEDEIEKLEGNIMALASDNDKLTTENEALKSEIDNLKSTIIKLNTKLRTEEDKKKIREATMSSPQIERAFNRKFKFSNLWSR